MPVAFHYHAPLQPSTAAVFASPHSGRNYPEKLLRASVLDAATLRSSEDAFVDDLIAGAPQFGAALLLGGVPRAYVDYNRAATELDAALIDGVPRGTLNPRVSSGLGVIPRVVAGGRAIYRGKLSRAEADERLATCWYPYHAQLALMLRDTRARFGRAILFDIHSMPHDALLGFGPRFGARPDVVLGDRFGASCAAPLVDRIEGVLRAAGLSVARNAPFAGAYITQHYGRPSAGQHAVQIEIDRALYLDEARIRPSRNYAAFRDLMTGIVADLCALGRPGVDEVPLAAE